MGCVEARPDGCWRAWPMVVAAAGGRKRRTLDAVRQGTEDKKPLLMAARKVLGQGEKKALWR